MESIAQIALVANEQEATGVIRIACLRLLLVCSDLGTELNGASHQHVARGVVIWGWIVTRIGLADVCREGAPRLVASEDEIVVATSIIG